MTPTKTKVAVVIGRFQVPSLTRGHELLLKAGIENYDRLLVFIGVSPVDGHSAENPLTFEQRCINVRERTMDHAFTAILPLLDKPSHDDWSKQVDITIGAFYPDADVDLLYGRESGFPVYYTGRYKIREVRHEPELLCSGTAERKSILLSMNKEFMRGQTYALNQQYPHAYPTVDMALVKNIHDSRTSNKADNLRVYVIQRADTGVWCFPGGFLDPGETLEEAAVRELREETGLYVESGLRYLKSFVVNDWRYRAVRDKITTAFFMGWYAFGRETLKSDEVRAGMWVNPFAFTDIAPHHLPLLVHLRETLKENV